MKILLVSSGSGSRGGGEIYLHFLAKGLVDAGHDVIAMVPDRPIMDELAQNFPNQVKVERIPFKPTYERKSRGIGAVFDGAQQKHMAQCFKALDPDIVHLNQQVAEDGLDLLRAIAMSGLPWVSTIHVGLSAAALKASLGPIRDFVTHRVLRGTDGQFITVSAASKNQLVDRLGQDTGRFEVVHNGVLRPDPDDLRAARIAARSDWRVDDHEIVFGAVGRIEAQKNPLALIDHVHAAGLSEAVKVVWIGDGSLRDDLEAHAQEKNVSLWVDGWRSDASTRLAGFDVFLLPSKFEGLPLAILEAMHAGVPVIAPNTDGIPEAIENSVTGFLCAADTDWQAAAQALASDDVLRARMSKAAKQKAIDGFSEISMARRTLEIYQSRIST